MSLVRQLFFVITCCVACSGILVAQQLTVVSAPPSGTVGTSYSFQFTATGGKGPYTWSYNTDFPLPPGLGFSNGLLSGTPFQAGSFLFQVFVFDPATQLEGSGSYSINIVPCTPTFVTTSPLPPGEVNVFYKQTITATGCATPYTFSGSSNPFDPNSLPNWATLAPGGTNSVILSGTPSSTDAGTKTISITVTDANGGSSSATAFSLTINPPPSITTKSPLPGGTVGVPYPQVQLNAAGGVPPYTFLGTVLAPGLVLKSDGTLSGTPTKAGTFQVMAEVRDNFQIVSPTATLQVTIADNVPAVQATPASLTFTANAGGDPPPPQALFVLANPNSNAAPTFQVLMDNGQANTPPSFSLTVKRAGGSAPAQLTVSADQGNQAGGSSGARIRIIDGQGLETDVPVTLNVNAAPPQLQALPATVQVTASAQRPGVIEKDLALSNAGGGGPLAYSIAVLNNSPWITGVTPSSGQTVRGSFVFAQVFIDTSLLQQSASDVLRISFAGGHVDVPVFVFLANDGPAIASDASGVVFEAQQGGIYSLSKTIQILNTDTTGSTVNWTAQVLSGEDLVSLGSASGMSTFSVPSPLTLTLEQNATQLQAGPHYELLSVSDPNAQNSPLMIEVVLDLNAANSTPVFDLNPSGVYFAVVAGGAKTQPQVVTVNTSSAAALPFQVSTSTDDGGSWLIASAASGKASGQNPGSFSLSVDPSRLTTGLHTAQASVSMSGIIKSVNVTAVVLPAGGVATDAKIGGDPTGTIRPAAAGCSPSKLALTEAGLVNNFSVPASWPATLIVQLHDDCGGQVANGSVVASFSNGDAPLALRTNGQAGTYSATWQPGAVSPQMVVTFNATAAALPPATMQLLGGVASNQNQVPVLTQGGIVNAYYPVPSGPVSPGTDVQMFGSGLASTSGSTGAPPLPPTFNGTTVLVGGLPAPLFNLSNGELDVQIPAELAPNQQYFVVVSTNGALTLPQPLVVVALQPAVQAYPDGQCGPGFLSQECYIHLAALHSDGTPVNANSPASPGEPLIAYLLGMGATDPSVPSGTAAPATDPMAQAVAQPVLTVNGESAPITYAGLSANMVGIYEIDFMVPMDASAGDLPVVITQNGVPANTTLLTVAQPAQ
ncbi:MAG TPA: putative Ig domain-containing protein [Bryobacteraceae bacterium]|nr:putative Ig domain-containing protein [Bryobacteraceae bacterium]